MSGDLPVSFLIHRIYYDLLKYLEAVLSLLTRDQQEGLDFQVWSRLLQTQEQTLEYQMVYQIELEHV